MTTKITRNIIESFLSCKYEGHLKLAGQLGIQSDYQSLLATSRDAIRRCAFDKISASHSGEEDVQRDSKEMPFITNKSGHGIYRMVFFARHPLPTRIWGDIARGPNRQLFDD